MSLEFIHKEKKDLICSLRLAVELKKDLIKNLELDSKRYSDLNGWLFNAKITALKISITVLSNHIRELESSSTNHIPDYLKDRISYPELSNRDN